MDERVYSLLLRFYPQEFRHAFAERLTELFRYRRDQARFRGGFLWRTRFWWFITWDLLSSAMSERLGMGSHSPAVQRVRDKWGGNGMDGWVRDLGYSVRRLTRSPGFTLAALTILALAIGFNTAAFSLVNAVLLQPPPFEEPDRLVEILQDSDGGGPSSTSYPAFLDIAEHTELFTDVAARSFYGAGLGVGDDVVPVSVEHATSGYFPVLGLRTMRGRWFEEAEDHIGGPPVAVITHRYWTNHFDSDPSVLGRTLQLDGNPVTVVGIGPESFNGGRGITTGDFWLSISAATPTGRAFGSLTRRQDHPYRVVARLASGVSPDEAQAGMDQLASSLARDFPDLNRGRNIHVLPMTLIGAENRGDYLPAAFLIMGIVGMVLLVASINLANLLLVRGMSREREIGIRLAMGGSRLRLIRVVFGETVVLATMGAALGLGLTYWLMTLLGRMELSLGGPVNLDIRLDAQVLLFTLVVAGGASILAGLLPALRITSPGATSMLRGDRPNRRPGRRLSLIGALVSAQLAVSLILLVAAGLFVDATLNASNADPGFDPENLTIVSMDLRSLSLAPEEVNATYARLEERIEALPQVASVTRAYSVPVGQRGTTTLLVGDLVDGRRRPVEVPWNYVSADYFQLLEIAVLHGRLFEDQDRRDAPPRAVVSRAMAQSFWGRTDIIGETYVSEGAPDEPVEIIGVVEDVKVGSLTESPRPSVYFNAQRGAIPTANFLIRTAGDGSELSVIAPVRQIVRDVSGEIRIPRVITMEAFLANTLGQQRLVSRVLISIGLLALALAGLGVYSVVSFRVSRRVSEVGIRMALGAERGSVLGLFIREMMVLAGIGVVLGTAAAFPVARVIGLVFTGSQGIPAPVLLTGIGTLGAIALLATAIPARRASLLDPAKTLRQE